MQDATQVMKKTFAEAWLRNPNNAFAAGLEVSGHDPSLALQMSSAWVGDPEVAKYKRELVAERGEEAFLPTKSAILHDILDRARTCPHNDDYVKLMRLAADMRGHIEKPGVTVNNNVSVTTNKVMTMPVFIGHNGAPINDDEWGKLLLQNQEALTGK